MEDDGHIFVKLGEMVDWFGIELLLIQQEQGKEGLNRPYFSQESDVPVPCRKLLSPLFVWRVAEVDEVTGGQGKGHLQGLPVVKV
jgi:hypothetical protein